VNSPPLPRRGIHPNRVYGFRKTTRQS